MFKVINMITNFQLKIRFIDGRGIYAYKITPWIVSAQNINIVFSVVGSYLLWAAATWLRFDFHKLEETIFNPASVEYLWDYPIEGEK
jgi:predicted metalloprotease with PDZ domain